MHWWQCSYAHLKYEHLVDIVKKKTCATKVLFGISLWSIIGCNFSEELISAFFMKNSHMQFTFCSKQIGHSEIIFYSLPFCLNAGIFLFIGFFSKWYLNNVEAAVKKILKFFGGKKKILPFLPVIVNSSLWTKVRV